MLKKKIGFLLPDLGTGGSQWVMIQFANYISKNITNIDLVTLSNNGSYKNIIYKKINIINLSKKRLLFSVLNLIKIVNENKYETFISSQSYLNFVTIAIFKIFSNKTKIIIRESNTISNKYVFKNKYEKFKEFIFKKSYNFADIIIAPSLGVKDNLINKYKINFKKIIVINNPVDLNLINNFANLKMQTKDYDFFKKPTIISIGRLTHQKNFSFLIEAFSEINKSRKYNLLILGEGTLKKNLLKQVAFLKQKNSIYLLGFKDNPFPYINASRAFVLTSLWEGMPNVLLQSLALNTPVISFDCQSGPREILENGKYGELIKINNKEQLKIKIVEAFDNKLKKKYPINEFKKKYDISNIGKKLIDII